MIEHPFRRTFAAQLSSQADVSGRPYTVGDTLLNVKLKPTSVRTEMSPQGSHDARMPHFAFTSTCSERESTPQRRMAVGADREEFCGESQTRNTAPNHSRLCHGCIKHTAQTFGITLFDAKGGTMTSETVTRVHYNRTSNKTGCNGIVTTH